MAAYDLMPSARPEGGVLFRSISFGPDDRQAHRDWLMTQAQSIFETWPEHWGECPMSWYYLLEWAALEP